MHDITRYLCFLLILTSCALPPNPPPPGLGGGFGAAAAGTAYTDGTGKLALSPQEIVLAPSETATLAIQVNAQDVIYKHGYIYKAGKWERLEFSGKPVPDSDWLQDARTTASVTLDSFPPGRNLVIAYGCKHTGDNWNCNENKWMISFFTVIQRTAATAPPPPPPPVEQTSTQTVQAQPSQKPQQECRDTDNTHLYDPAVSVTPTSRPDAFTRGEATYIDSAGARQIREDHCMIHPRDLVPVLVEKSCAPGKKDVVIETVIRCPGECKNAACVTPPGTTALTTTQPTAEKSAETKPTTSPATCTDSDSGKTYEKSGRIVATWTENGKAATFAGEDACLTITAEITQTSPSCKPDATSKTSCKVREHYCSPESPQPYSLEDKSCEHGCDKGACLPPPTCVENKDKPCGCDNKGVTNCDGTCSISSAPANFGQACNRNACGGTGVVKCDETCSSQAPLAPVNLGQACNCGGTIGCDGICSKPACGVGQTCTDGQCVSSCSPQQGQACNRNACGGSGTVQCDGTCSSPAPFVPLNIGQACNRNQCGGGGTIDCSGGCNSGSPFVPSNLGQACGCGGTIQCSGQCSTSDCSSGQICQNGACGCTPLQGQSCGNYGTYDCAGNCQNQCPGGQVRANDGVCTAPCGRCLVAPAQNCDQACQNLRQGYTSGTCAAPSSTNVGACCSCSKPAPTYTAPTYTAPTSNCRTGTGTCRMQNGCSAYMHQVWTNGNQAQGCTNVYSIINTRVCGTTPGGNQCDGSSSTSIYRDQCVCP